MSKNSYEQFFKKAGQVQRSDEMPVDRVQFKTKSAAKKPAPSDRPKASEKQLRAAMKMRKKAPPLPKKAVLGLLVSLALASAYVLAPETFDKFLSKIEIRALGQAEAADSPAEKSAAASKKEENPAGDKSAATSNQGPGGKSAVSEDASHFDKLRQRKEELDAREKELNELEEELQKQKVELDKRITQLEDMRNQIGQTLKDRVDVDQEKVNKLVDLYSNMKPKQAADVIGSLNEELAVEVLAKMKKKNAAEVMNLLSPEKARILSEKYTGYRRISSQEPKG